MNDPILPIFTGQFYLPTGGGDHMSCYEGLEAGAEAIKNLEREGEVTIKRVIVIVIDEDKEW